jgi:hypothetical protein
MTLAHGTDHKNYYFTRCQDIHPELFQWCRGFNLVQDHCNEAKWFHAPMQVLLTRYNEVPFQQLFEMTLVAARYGNIDFFRYSMVRIFRYRPQRGITRYSLINLWGKRANWKDILPREYRDMSTDPRTGILNHYWNKLICEILKEAFRGRHLEICNCLFRHINNGYVYIINNKWLLEEVFQSMKNDTDDLKKCLRWSDAESRKHTLHNKLGSGFTEELLTMIVIRIESFGFMPQIDYPLPLLSLFSRLVKIAISIDREDILSILMKVSSMWASQLQLQEMIFIISDSKCLSKHWKTVMVWVRLLSPSSIFDCELLWVLFAHRLWRYLFETNDPEILLHIIETIPIKDVKRVVSQFVSKFDHEHDCCQALRKAGYLPSHDDNDDHHHKQRRT